MIRLFFFKQTCIHFVVKNNNNKDLEKKEEEKKIRYIQLPYMNGVDGGVCFKKPCPQT